MLGRNLEPEVETKAGIPCPRCQVGQLFWQWEVDEESRNEQELVCLQCGHRIERLLSAEEYLLISSPSFLPAKIITEGQSNTGTIYHRVKSWDSSQKDPEFFLCERPGCEVWKPRKRPE